MYWGVEFRFLSLLTEMLKHLLMLLKNYKEREERGHDDIGQNMENDYMQFMNICRTYDKRRLFFFFFFLNKKKIKKTVIILLGRDRLSYSLT
jgi:hypothetical protein